RQVRRVAPERAGRGSRPRGLPPLVLRCRDSLGRARAQGEHMRPEKDALGRPDEPLRSLLRDAQAARAAWFASLAGGTDAAHAAMHDRRWFAPLDTDRLRA